MGKEPPEGKEHLQSQGVGVSSAAAPSSASQEQTSNTTGQGSLQAASFIQDEVKIVKEATSPANIEPESQSDGAEQNVIFEILELQEDAHLYKEPGDDSGASSESIKGGELVLARSDLIVRLPDAQDSPWIFVHVPKDTEIKSMSDVPLTYEDGWLKRNLLVETPWKTGERAAVTAPDPPEHPFFYMLRVLPQWRDGVPKWLHNTCAEHFPGKVYGTMVGGEIVVQRPSGAIPERLAAPYLELLRPRDRAKIVAKSTGLGLLSASLVVGVAYGYMSYDRERRGQRGLTWHGYVQWLGFSTLFLTPFAYFPCFIFCMTPFGTTSFIFWANAMLFYDLFHE